MAYGAFLIVAIIFAAPGWREAAKFEQANGRTPWNIPAYGWAAIVLLSGLLIGGVLLVVARRTTEPIVPAATPPARAHAPHVPEPGKPDDSLAAQQWNPPNLGPRTILPD